MIFIGYELGSKGYQFWDAAHHCIKISCDAKFDETLFPVKEATKSQASQNDLPISESDNESDNSGLDLVIPAHSSPRPPCQANLHQDHQDLQRKPTRTHPLPHLQFNRVCNLLDRVHHLQDLLIPFHDIPFALQRSVWLTKVNNLLEKT